MSARDREFLDLGSHARTSGFFSVRIIPRARLTGGGSNISRTTAKEHDLGAHTRPRKSKNRFLAHSRRCAGPVGRVPEEANVRGAPPPRAGDGLTGRRQGGAWVAQERAVGKLSLYLSHGESSACALAMTDEHRPPPASRAIRRSSNPRPDAAAPGGWRIIAGFVIAPAILVSQVVALFGGVSRAWAWRGFGLRTRTSRPSTQRSPRPEIGASLSV